MESLFYSYNFEVKSAYIIRISGHKGSEERAKRCADSCDKADMPWQYWDGYDGTGEGIVVPDHHSGILKMIKVTDHYLSRTEVACALSHISLWQKCAIEDSPIVILEHDAVMVQAYRSHVLHNSICYLGSDEQVNQGWKVMPTPPHASDGPNFHFILRAHAYAIDPAVAKNLLSHVLQQGINGPTDMLMRADLFPIHQMGVFAYNVKEEESTIQQRKDENGIRKRNDNLEF